MGDKMHVFQASNWSDTVNKKDILKVECELSTLE